MSEVGMSVARVHRDVGRDAVDLGAPTMRGFGALARETPARAAVHALGAALAVGVAGDLLLRAGAPAVNVLLCTALGLALLAWLARERGRPMTATSRTWHLARWRAARLVTHAERAGHLAPWRAVCERGLHTPIPATRS